MARIVRTRSPSLYFATDKNIFDALTRRKVDCKTIKKLFEDRNIIVSLKTPREELARYFARLTHDFQDHQQIANRLGIVARRERITSMQVDGVDSTDVLVREIATLRAELEALGDVIHVTRTGENFSLEITYTIIDYGKTEFAQVHTRDGVVELLRESDTYTIRSTQNDYIAGARDQLLANIEKSESRQLARRVVSLHDILDHTIRCKFFAELVDKVPDFHRIDVLSMYVYKPKPTAQADENDNSEPAGEGETHIEKISMRGIGVSRSELLQELTRDGYYITRVQWTIQKTFSAGKVYEIEAGFEDPKDCTGFSFILSGVYAVESGVVSTKLRQAADGRPCVLKLFRGRYIRPVEGSGRMLFGGLPR